MDLRRKKVVFYTCLGLMLFHLIMLGIYAVPSKLKSPLVDQLNKWYVLPQFHHNFVVFAPDPPLGNSHFVYRYQVENGTWSNWEENGTELLQKARENPFSAQYKIWKIQYLVGFRLQQLYASYFENPQIQHLDSATIHKLTIQGIVRSKAYENANRYALAQANMPVKRVQVGFLHLPLKNAKEEPLIRTIFPPQNVLE